MNKQRKIISSNKKAFFDYTIEEKYEAGIELSGTEVKSIRQGKVNLKDSYAFVKNSEVFICNMHISPYEKGNIFNLDPIRTRKLLMHKSEIMKLFGLIKQKGLTLIPLNIYLDGKWFKVELGLGKGKKAHDKRDAIAERDANREIANRLKIAVR